MSEQSELDEILEVAKVNWQTSPDEIFDKGVMANAKNQLLDWHNKQVEAVLDRLEKQAKSLIRNPDGSSIGAEYIPLSAIEAEKEKL